MDNTNNLNVLMCGTRYKHKKGFEFTESLFPDSWLFLFFHTDFVCGTKYGKQQGGAYSYILYPPHSDVYHTNTDNSKTGFCNDWIYLNGSFVQKISKEKNIPLNVIVPFYNIDGITKIIDDINYELSNNFLYKEERIRVLVTDLFIELARNDAGKYIDSGVDTYAILNEVRRKMLENYKSKYTLSALAKLSGFSVSYFLSLYKKIYGVSPIDELIDYRILQSKAMLESNIISISEIAERCGFSGLYYFSRIFKRKVGMTPTQYRALHLNGNNI